MLHPRLRVGLVWLGAQSRLGYTATRHYHAASIHGQATGNRMMGFEDTTLWRTTLAKREGSDPHERARDLLRSAFCQMRERAKVLSDGIAKDNPSLT